MTEHKRVNFTTISAIPAAASLRFGADFLLEKDKTNGAGSGGGGSGGNIGSGADGGGKAKRPTKTVRLQLELFQSDSSKYPEFNYAKLVHLQKKKTKKLRQKSSNGGSDPFEENDDDVARIAEELERKYGNAYATGRGRSKKEDRDIGQGYDDNDSFIDNTDAYDEVVPEEVEPLEGGFYINCGALQFKKLQNEPTAVKLRTDEIIKMPDRPKKRILETSSESSSSSDDDEEEDAEEEDDDNDEEDEEDGEDEEAEDSEEESTSELGSKSKNNAEKQRKASNGVAVLPSSDSEKKSKDKSKKIVISSSSSSSPRPTVVVEGPVSDSEKERARQKSAVKTTTVKDMLKAKRDNFLKAQGEPKHTTNGKRTKSTEDCNVSSTEESADESEKKPQQQKSQSGQKQKAGNASEDNADRVRGVEAKLPELDAEALARIQEFKDFATAKGVIGKKFPFDTKLNDAFAKIDGALQTIDKLRRNAVFAHLEYHLQLPKYFLLRKTKALRIKDEKMKIKRAISRLRQAVMEAMPGVTVSFEAELRRFAETQTEHVNVDNPPDMPRKKFPWSNAIRELLYDLHQARFDAFQVLGTRKETLEAFVDGFLRTKVVELWPNSWMSFEELQKQIDRRAKDRKPTAPIGAYGKRDEDFATSSRSAANSETESIGSSSASGSLKRKNSEGRKASKAKAVKLTDPKSQQQHQQMQQQQPLQPLSAATINTATAGASASATLGGLEISPVKRTDHSILNIILHSTSPPPVAASSPPPTTPTLSAHLTMTTATTTASHPSVPPKHSTTAHVIDLDKYRSTNDILQTSKQLLNAAAAAAAASVSHCPPTATTTGAAAATAALKSTITTTSSTRKATSPSAITMHRSSSDSDGVEFVGVFPARASLPADLVCSPSNKAPKHKKTAQESHHKRSSASPAALNNFQRVESTLKQQFYEAASVTAASICNAKAASLMSLSPELLATVVNNNTNTTNNNNNGGNSGSSGSSSSKRYNKKQSAAQDYSGFEHVKAQKSSATASQDHHQ